MSASPTIRVIVCEPDRPGKLCDVANELSAVQTIVEGYIEVVYLHERLVIVCNEESWIRDMVYNRAGIRGTFFVCRVNAGEFASLTDADVALLGALLDKRSSD